MCLAMDCDAGSEGKNEGQRTTRVYVHLTALAIMQKSGCGAVRSEHGAGAQLSSAFSGPILPLWTPTASPALLSTVG